MTLSAPVRYALVAALALLAGVLFQKHIGTQNEVKTEIVRLEHERRVVDTVYKHDTVEVRKMRTEYAIKRDTLLKNVTDTVQVKEFVKVADSTLVVDSIALKDCDKLRLINADLYKQQKKLTSFWNRFGIVVGPTINVAPTGEVRAGIGVTAGIRIFP